MSSFKSFIGDSGLKVLAMTRLTPCEYSVVLYLLNCAASGLDELITTERELASLIGHEEDDVHEAVTNLAERNLVRIRFGDGYSGSDRQSIRIGLQFDMSAWMHTYDKDATSSDAVVFPFRRGDSAHLVAMDGERSSADQAARLKSMPTWQRVLESFTRDRSLNPREMERAMRDAKMLVETHPVDQVLLMLRHFEHRIPTLSLLASSWQHYHEMFEEETQKVDLMDARQKHVESDNRVRESAEVLLRKGAEVGLTEEEVTVLEILSRHRHPRRQLFWAYQTRSRYPNLKGFFEDNLENMLAVTSSGMVIKKKAKQDPTHGG